MIAFVFKLVRVLPVTCRSLYENEVGDKGASEIAAAMKSNFSITLLNLSYNKIKNQVRFVSVCAVACVYAVGTLPVRVRPFLHPACC